MSVSFLKSGEYVYKKTSGKDLKFAFLTPIKNVYDKAPLYFLIPGGGWHSADSQSMINFSEKSVNILRQNGFAVVSVEYRTVNDINKISDAVCDCFDALGYLFEHRNEYNLDMQNIVTSGHSAGAHLALMLAYSSGKLFGSKYDFNKSKCRIISVAALSAPTVLYEGEYPKTIGFSTDYLFEDPGSISERKKVSPIDYVDEKCPPTILFAGTDDNLVYCNSSELLFEKLNENNIKSLLVLSKNSGHSFEKLPDGNEPSVSYEEIQVQLAEYVMQCYQDHN